MNEVTQHNTGRLRLGAWVAVFFGAFALALALGSLLWIPEWERFVEIVNAGLVLAAGWAAVQLFRALLRSVRANDPPAWRIAVKVLGAIILFGSWAFAALIASVMMVEGFPFGATYYKQFEFPEHNTTVYLYDSSFLDPEATIFLRQGALPLRSKALVLGTSPRNVDVVQHGSLLMVNGRQLDLVSGQVTH